MGLRLNHRLGLFTSLAALTGTAVIGGMAYLVSSQTIGDQLRAQSLSASSQLAMRVGGELKLLADRGRFYVSTANRAGFEKDGELLAVSILSQSADSETWNTETRWTRPPGDPAYLSAEMVAAMDQKYPVDPSRIALGQSDVFFARAGSMGVLRIAVPFGEGAAGGYAKALLIDAKLGKLQALFGHREGVFAFMTSARGQLVIASDAGHFASGEDLSQLAALNEARDSHPSQGSFEYRETPQSEFQHAAYARVVSSVWASSGLTVFAQSPRSLAWAALQPLIVGLTAAGLVFAALLGLCIGWLGPRWAWAEGLVGNDGKKTAYAPESAETSAAITSTSATLVKIQDPKIRQAFTQGQVKLAGERVQAAVLHAHLHGVDRLSKKSDPEKLLRLLNEFNQAAVQAIESRQGIVDHMHGGSIVAFWGVPKGHSTDVPHAIQAAQDIRAAAQHLIEELSGSANSPARLAMGLDYGPLTVGQVGSAGRFEYSAVGEALDVAARIQEFAEQFGTDLIMTAPAAERAGKEFSTEKLADGDDGTPELHELTATGEETEPSLGETSATSAA
jgi:class 3 adenylate cyclase